MLSHKHKELVASYFLSFLSSSLWFFTPPTSPIVSAAECVAGVLWLGGDYHWLQCLLRVIPLQTLQLHPLLHSGWVVEPVWVWIALWCYYCIMFQGSCWGVGGGADWNLSCCGWRDPCNGRDINVSCWLDCSVSCGRSVSVLLTELAVWLLWLVVSNQQCMNCVLVVLMAELSSIGLCKLAVMQVSSVSVVI